MKVTYIKEYHRNDIEHNKGDLVELEATAVKQVVFTSKYIYLYNKKGDLIGTPLPLKGIYSTINNITIEELRKEEAER